MSSVTTITDLNKLSEDVEEYIQSFNTTVHLSKSLNKKKNNEKVAALTKTKLFQKNNQTRALVNHQDSDEIFELVKEIFTFVKGHRDLRLERSDVEVGLNQSELSKQDEQYQRNEIIKKGFGFCKTLLKYLEVNVATGNSKPQQQQKSFVGAVKAQSEQARNSKQQESQSGHKAIVLDDEEEEELHE